MKHATSRELYAYWNRLRDGAPAPRRSQIEPSDIRRVLADTFILEVADRESYPIRLAGTHICSAYGREIKGLDFLDFWAQQDRDAIASLCTGIAEDAAAAVVSIEAATARRRTAAFELLLMPLRHAGPGYDRILGSFAPFEQPYWLGTEAIVAQAITSLRLIWPDEQPVFLRRASDRIAAGPPAVPFPLEGHRRRGHLTVLDGGKD